MKNKSKPIIAMKSSVEEESIAIEKTAMPQTLAEKSSDPINAEEMITSISKYLQKDIRGGSSEEGVITYNGLKRSPGKFYGGTENPVTFSTSHRMNYDGRFSATQLFSKAFFYASDEREKTNVQELSNALNTILELKGVSFDWKSDGKKDIGVIAQEVAKVIPEAVIDSGERLSVNPAVLIAYLIESIRELKNEVNELKNGKDTHKE